MSENMDELREKQPIFHELSHDITDCEMLVILKVVILYGDYCVLVLFQVLLHSECNSLTISA